MTSMTAQALAQIQWHLGMDLSELKACKGLQIQRFVAQSQP